MSRLMTVRAYCRRQRSSGRATHEEPDDDATERHERTKGAEDDVHGRDRGLQDDRVDGRLARRHFGKRLGHVALGGRDVGQACEGEPRAVERAVAAQRDDKGEEHAAERAEEGFAKVERDGVRVGDQIRRKDDEVGDIGENELASQRGDEAARASDMTRPI